MFAAAQAARRTALRLGLLVLLSGFVLAAMASEDDPHAHHREMMKKSQPGPSARATVEVPDTTLLTQDGDALKLSSEVMGDRIVVVDFIYTTCTTVCPVLSAILSQVQREVGDRLGKDVVLVSITVDPLRDSPARLKDYSARLQARDGWYWLTGSKTDIDDVLRAMGAYTPSFKDHPSMILVGDSSNDTWSRYVGFPGANQILKKIDELSTARNAQAAVTE